jgi:hypothetical protein
MTQKLEIFVNYLVHDSLSLVIVLKQMNPVQGFFFKLILMLIPQFLYK